MTTAMWRAVAGFSGAMAVAMGAVGAHAVSDAHAASMIEKAALYHLIHSVLLLWLANEAGRLMVISRLCFLTGIVFFSGGLYLQYLSNILFLKPFIPFGGLCYIAGWLVIGGAAVFKKRSH